MFVFAKTYWKMYKAKYKGSIRQMRRGEWISEKNLQIFYTTGFSL